MKLGLPPLTRRTVAQYLALEIGPFTFPCPYFQNILGKKALAVFAGKGDPKEIKKETLKLFCKLGKNFTSYDKESLRLNMVMAGIGIDCSGLVVRILDCLLREKGLGGIGKNIRPKNLTLLSFLRYRFRPFTNISADTVSSKANCIEIRNLDDVQPGDMIRVGAGHVAVIIEVEKKKGKTVRITYCHSTWDYLDQYGVRTGKILIVEPNRPLEKQRWTEYYRGRNWMLEDYLRSKTSDRGIRRLKVLAKCS